jgi:GntR family transcriptional regulator / MocR family aminotransferase
MPRVAASFLPPIMLDRTSRAPMYRQLYEWFRRSIIEGRLRPGQRVPSTRGLAAELGISRIPVLAAFEQLLAEGYVEAFVGAGTCVARSIPEDRAGVPVAGARSRAQEQGERRGLRRVSRRSARWGDGGHAARHPWTEILGPFRATLPALDQFPGEVWGKIVARHARVPPATAMAYGDAMGYLPFREAIAEYLGVARAVQCDASQVLVTTGSQLALHLAAQVLLDPGDRVWMEEPGYPGARLAFTAAGARMVPVHVDDEGLDIAPHVRRASAARAAYITPSHQYPMGTTMSAARRIMLLDWAAQSGMWVIEDDYDSEYRYESRPVASLQGQDADGRVIYIGTFSKVLFPSLRLGYMVVPRDLVPAFAAVRDATDIFSSVLYQAVMTDFIREGHFARHLRRMRMLYMRRREALVLAIRAEMGDLLEVVGTAAGMHLVALLPPRVDDVAVAMESARRGVSVIPLSSCYIKAPSRSGLILGFGGAPGEQLGGAMRTLRQCVSVG